VAGPSLSGIALTLICDGRAGLRELRARFQRRRLDGRWYAIGLFTVPATLLLVLAVLSLLLSPNYQPGFMPLGLVFGLLAGFFEEIGWTGFALPRLRARWGTLAGGLLLGLLWALWHGLADYSGNIAAMQDQWLLDFFVYWLVPLPAYRLLIARVYERTQSLWLAQWMHAAYTGSLAVFSPLGVGLAEGLVWKAAFVAVLWAVVLGLVLAGHRAPARAPAGVISRPS
jgi:membrane protease YdiL (CAAX protease family)